MAGNGNHTTSLNTYLKVYGALLVLTVLTVWIAQFHFGALNTVIAMFIATIKVLVVMYWFMHLNHDTTLNKVVIGSAFFFVFVFFGFIAIDVFSRHNFSTTELSKPQPVQQQTTEEAPKAE